MKSEQAPTTSPCTAMTNPGTAITSEITSTASIDKSEKVSGLFFD
jgi:hypothetical protein